MADSSKPHGPEPAAVVPPALPAGRQAVLVALDQEVRQPSRQHRRVNRPRQRLHEGGQVGRRRGQDFLTVGFQFGPGRLRVTQEQLDVLGVELAYAAK